MVYIVNTIISLLEYHVVINSAQNDVVVRDLVVVVVVVVGFAFFVSGKKDQ
jgi:hypothetical protein